MSMSRCSVNDIFIPSHGYRFHAQSSQHFPIIWRWGGTSPWTHGQGGTEPQTGLHGPCIGDPESELSSRASWEACANKGSWWAVNSPLPSAPLPLVPVCHVERTGWEWRLCPKRKGDLPEMVPGVSWSQRGWGAWGRGWEGTPKSPGHPQHLSVSAAIASGSPLHGVQGLCSPCTHSRLLGQSWIARSELKLFQELSLIYKSWGLETSRRGKRLAQCDSFWVIFFGSRSSVADPDTTPPCPNGSNQNRDPLEKWRHTWAAWGLHGKAISMATDPSPKKRCEVTWDRNRIVFTFAPG